MLSLWKYSGSIPQSVKLVCGYIASRILAVSKYFFKKEKSFELKIKFTSTKRCYKNKIQMKYFHVLLYYCQSKERGTTVSKKGKHQTLNKINSMEW